MWGVKISREAVAGVLGRGARPDMIRIAISQAAFDAIALTLALGSMNFENATDEHGQRLIWLDRAIVDRLRSLRARARLVAT
jgi:hypothetical protein